MGSGSQLERVRQAQLRKLSGCRHPGDNVPVLECLLVLVAAFAAAAARAVTPLRPAPTPPDTESVLILHGAFNYPGYWWDHTDLTVAVQAHPNVDEESLAAVHQAIADWDYALRQEFGGLITLTDVTDQYTAKHKADIVLHYNPTAGGTVFGGYAICGANSCPNVIVRSDLPLPIDFTYPPQYLYYVTMHELGHALGLGHAQPLTESTDLMGYGWHWSNGIVPTLSECDLAGIAVVFAWALQGVDPYPPTQPSVACF